MPLTAGVMRDRETMHALSVRIIDPNLVTTTTGPEKSRRHKPGLSFSKKRIKCSQPWYHSPAEGKGCGKSVNAIVKT